MLNTHSTGVSLLQHHYHNIILLGKSCPFVGTHWATFDKLWLTFAKNTPTLVINSSILVGHSPILVKNTPILVKNSPVFVKNSPICGKNTPVFDKQLNIIHSFSTPFINQLLHYGVKTACVVVQIKFYGKINLCASRN